MELLGLEPPAAILELFDTPYLVALDLLDRQTEMSLRLSGECMTICSGIPGSTAGQNDPSATLAMQYPCAVAV